jgi:DNA gyrase/topoisomerase IV subunit B
MNEQSMTDDTLIVIRQRLVNLSGIFENIKFTLNGEVIKYSKIDLLKAFVPVGEYHIDENYAIAIGTSTSNEFKQFSLINGLNITASSAINYISKYLVDGVKEKLPKKYDDIKPGDIKTKIQIVMIGNKFPTIVWDGQTKEKLNNSDADIRKYLGEDWKTIIDKVVKNNDIIKPITFLYDAKKDAEERENAAKTDKEIKKLFVPKLSLATKKKYILALIEGDSAKNGIMQAFGREYISYLPGKGVIMNALTNPMSKITANNEFKELMSTLGLTFSKDNTAAKMTHENIVIMTDQDVDGAHIKGLWFAFFQRFVPDIFEMGKLWILDTPIKVAKNAKEELIKPFFTEQEFLAYMKKGNKPSIVEYKKGLGSFNPKEYNDVFEKVKVEDCLYRVLPPDETDIQLMMNYLDDDSAPRKELIKEYMKDFDPNMI